MKAFVTTILRQEIEVPEGTDRESVLEFLAENQSFGDAFLGVSDMTQRFRGFVTKIAIKYATVDTGVGLYKVPMNMLTLVDKELA